MSKFCTNCGNPAGPDDRFCAYCGKPIPQTAPQATVPMPQESAAAKTAVTSAAKTAVSGPVNKKLIAGILAAVLLVGGVAIAAMSGGDGDDPSAVSGTSSSSSSGQSTGNQQPSSPESSDGPVISAQPVTVAATANYDSWQEVPANALPDLHYWSGRTIGYADEPAKGTDCYYYEYGCKSAETRAIFNEYLEALQANGFTLVNHYHKYGESWGLTCDAAPEAETVKMMYTDTPCHVSIYNDDGIMTFYISLDLVVCDTGLRRDGTTADLRPQGTSVAAGLLRLPDGSYQTSDGRLTAAVGTAMVLRDGVSYTTEAEYTRGSSNDRLNIDGYYRNESIFFRAKAGYLVEGDVLTQRELRQWKQYSKDKDGQNTYKYSTVADLSVAHDGEWESPTYSSTKYTVMDECSVRVMYMDDGGDAVFYIYARFFDGEPKEIEALAVVSTADDEGAFSNATYINVGNTVTLNYPHREYGSNWHTFDWSIVEGTGNVSIQTAGDTCTVTALKAGVAAVKVSYGYSTEEPDPLLGTPRTVSHTKTETYYFVVQ